MILLTGATGLLGSYLVDTLLARGHALRVLLRDAAHRSRPWLDRVEVVDGDLLDTQALAQAVQGVDAVVHAAALVSFHRQDRDRLMQVNGEGTAHLVNACLAAGGPRLVHISSVAALGPASEGQATTEETPWQPSPHLSGYARSKRRAELEVYRGIAEGLSAVILNPGVILGAAPDWSLSSAQLFARVAEGLRFYLAGQTALVAAQDVAEACALLLQQPAWKPGERYLLVADNWPTQRLLCSMAESLGKQGPTQRLPGWWALVAARLAERMMGRKSPLTLEAVRGGLSLQTYDGTKINSLGLRYTPPQAVIEEMARAWRNRPTS